MARNRNNRPRRRRQPAPAAAARALAPPATATAVPPTALPPTAAPTPFAVAYFYKPSREAAIAAGVPLPHAALSIPVSRAQGVAMSVLLPISPYHIEATAALCSSSSAAPCSSSSAAPGPSSPSSPSAAADPSARVALPSFLYPATTSIHPKHFDVADSFVRIEHYSPGSIVLPHPLPGKSYSAVLYSTDQFDPKQDLNVLPVIEVRQTLELRSALLREGPMHVRIMELQAVSDATSVYDMVRVKTTVGWKVSPEQSVFADLSVIRGKTSELIHQLLPQLEIDPKDRNVGRTCKRRLKLIKKKSRWVRKRVVGDVISRILCQEISRAITDVQSLKPQEDHAYLKDLIPSFITRLSAELAKGLTFIL